MNEDRDNRTERYYQESAWALAERIVELEDEAAEVRAATLREAADTIRDINPDSGSEFSAGVGWVELELRSMANGEGN